MLSLTQKLGKRERFVKVSRYHLQMPSPEQEIGFKIAPTLGALPLILFL